MRVLSKSLSVVGYVDNVMNQIDVTKVNSKYLQGKVDSKVLPA